MLYTPKQVFSELSSRRKEALRRTRKRGYKLEFNVSTDYIVEIYNKQKGLCAISKRPLRFDKGTREVKNPDGCSIDRIDNNKGYVEGNIQLLLHWCNNAKSTYGEKLLKEMAKCIALNE